MKNYIKPHPWKIIEEGFSAESNKVSESIFSIGNGRMGQRANFEEKYSGETLRGSYVAGVYYPDKTRVGWWKNGYPEYFAKILNAANWIGIDVSVDGEELDLATAEVESFSRVLDMRSASIERTFVAKLPSGKRVSVSCSRFISITDADCAAIRYSVTLLGFAGEVAFMPYLSLDVYNQDSNYDERFWTEVGRSVESGAACITGETRKTGFRVATAMRWMIEAAGAELGVEAETESREFHVGNRAEVALEAGQDATIFKYVANISSLHHPANQLDAVAEATAAAALGKGYDRMFAEHDAAWKRKWAECDIVIEGDVSAQQAIRFNILQMHQTYTGDDERLNIGPKGFTGEKYGGVTYWDTEAYGLPFFLKTAPPAVARQLLVYRHRHLGKAIENAAKLGFGDGAALYPMVTINGEECHNEWEITFEEIHRNGAMAYAIHNYINHTGDRAYLADCGLEVLIGLSRFWRQRVQWAPRRDGYVMLGVTGPNEYENNINNNWYTNLLAKWTLEFTAESVASVKRDHPARYAEIADQTAFGAKGDELGAWAEIAAKIVLPVDAETGVFIQQDGFFDKDLQPVSALSEADRPINQNWSWDRILRSCYIKQADVLQGIYMFEDLFDTETIRRNFDFYEPMTVHESSLSPCIHSILATRLGYEEQAYEFYMRTARLDLDDYNNDTEDGLHITSMAGTWMAVVEGFGGARVREGELFLNPFLPKRWKFYSFRILFRGAVLSVEVARSKVTVRNASDQGVAFHLFDKECALGGNETLSERI